MIAVAMSETMNPTLLKALLASLPVFLLLSGSIVLFSRRSSLGTFSPLLGATCLLLVLLAHVFEATHLFPAMRWGEEHSLGHYLDLASAILALVLFPAGYLLDALTRPRS